MCISSISYSNSNFMLIRGPTIARDIMAIILYYVRIPMANLLSCLGLIVFMFSFRVYLCICFSHYSDPHGFASLFNVWSSQPDLVCYPYHISYHLQLLLPPHRLILPRLHLTTLKLASIGSTNPRMLDLPCNKDPNKLPLFRL